MTGRLFNIIKTIINRLAGTDSQIQNINSEIQNINGQLQDINDFVVAQDTINTTTPDVQCAYRKWNSGRAEFWFATSRTQGLSTSTWGNIFYLDSTAFNNIFNSFNDFRFVSVDCVQASSKGSQIINVIPYSIALTGITTLRFVTATQQSDAPYGFTIYATGTWK